MTTQDTITAVNAYADALEALGAQPIPMRDKTFAQIAKAGVKALDECQTWAEVAKESDVNLTLQAPDGTRVQYVVTHTPQGRSIERLMTQ